MLMWIMLPCQGKEKRRFLIGISARFGCPIDRDQGHLRDDGYTFGMIAKTFLSMPKAIGEFIMHRWCEIITVSLIAAAPWLVTTAGAAPISQSMSLQPALTPPVEGVHHHRGRRSGYRAGYRGSGFISAGIGAGALPSRFLAPPDPTVITDTDGAMHTRPALPTGTVQGIRMNLIGSLAGATERPIRRIE
jgi:hypothetical protein